MKACSTKPWPEIWLTSRGQAVQPIRALVEITFWKPQRASKTVRYARPCSSTSLLASGKETTVTLIFFFSFPFWLDNGMVKPIQALDRHVL
jgi:hypothetical protein